MADRLPEHTTEVLVIAVLLVSLAHANPVLSLQNSLSLTPTVTPTYAATATLCDPVSVAGRVITCADGATSAVTLPEGRNDAEQLVVLKAVHDALVAVDGRYDPSLPVLHGGPFYQDVIDELPQGAEGVVVFEYELESLLHGLVMDDALWQINLQLEALNQQLLGQLYLTVRGHAGSHPGPYCEIPLGGGMTEIRDANGTTLGFREEKPIDGSRDSGEVWFHGSAGHGSGLIGDDDKDNDGDLDNGFWDSLWKFLGLDGGDDDDGDDGADGIIYESEGAMYLVPPQVWAQPLIDAYAAGTIDAHQLDLLLQNEVQAHIFVEHFQLLDLSVTRVY